MDKDEGLIAELNEGRIPIYESGLEELVVGGSRREQLHFSTDLSGLVGSVDVLIVAVQTPQGGDGSVDLSSITAVAREVGWTLSREENASPRRGQ